MLHGKPEFMKLIALILGLGLERLATRVLHLRELRWLDPYFDVGLNRLRGVRTWLVYLGGVVLILLPLIPVAWASRALLQTGIPWDLPYLLFAVLVLFFCLGPRDLCKRGGGVLPGARKLRCCRSRARPRGTLRSGAFRRQGRCRRGGSHLRAGRRIDFFGVVFWFVVFGPVGAWLFRVSDLLRRRAATRAATIRNAKHRHCLRSKSFTGSSIGCPRGWRQSATH